MKPISLHFSKAYLYAHEIMGYISYIHAICILNHGLLYIWTELLSNFFGGSAHMRQELGTQMTPGGGFLDHDSL